MIKVKTFRHFGGSHAEFEFEAKDKEEALSLATFFAGLQPRPLTAADVNANRRDGESLADTKERLLKEGVPNAPASATTLKSSPAPAPTLTKSSGETKQSAPAVSYDDVKAAILAIAKESRDKATALLGRFGAKSGKDLKEEQWAGFHADAQRVIAGEYDPEQTDGND